MIVEKLFPETTLVLAQITHVNGFPDSGLQDITAKGLPAMAVFNSKLVHRSLTDRNRTIINTICKGILPVLTANADLANWSDRFSIDNMGDGFEELLNSLSFDYKVIHDKSSDDVNILRDYVHKTSDLEKTIFNVAQYLFQRYIENILNHAELCAQKRINNGKKEENIKVGAYTSNHGTTVVSVCLPVIGEFQFGLFGENTPEILIRERFLYSLCDRFLSTMQFYSEEAISFSRKQEDRKIYAQQAYDLEELYGLIKTDAVKINILSFTKMPKISRGFSQRNMEIASDIIVSTQRESNRDSLYEMLDMYQRSKGTCGPNGLI